MSPVTGTGWPPVSQPPKDDVSLHAQCHRALTQMPSSMKEQFGSIGYAKFGGNWYPILLVSPGDADEVEAMKEWLTRFNTAKQRQRNIPHLGYWIGDYRYGIVSPAAFVPLNEATSLHQAFQQKVNTILSSGIVAKENSEEEAYIIRAWNDLGTLQAVEPADRHRHVPWLTSVRNSPNRNCTSPINIPSTTYNSGSTPLFSTTFKNMEPSQLFAPSDGAGGNEANDADGNDYRGKESPTTTSPRARVRTPKEQARRNFASVQTRRAYHFRKNEKEIIPTLERLHAVTPQTGTPEIHSLLTTLEETISSMTWDFIRLHQVPSALKPAKKELKHRGENFSIIGNLRNMLRQRFEYSKTEFPGAYKPTYLQKASYLDKVRVVTKPESGSNTTTTREPAKAADTPSGLVGQKRDFSFGPSPIPKKPSPPVPPDNPAKKAKLPDTPTKSSNETPNQNAENLPVQTTYGRPEDEKKMREWLDSFRLPQSVANLLLKFGARCVEDVSILVDRCPELLQELPPLDRIKLCEAVAVPVAVKSEF